MKVYSEVDLSKWMLENCWSGAKDTLADLDSSEVDTLADYIEDILGGEASETEINDFVWFERDAIADILGYQDYEDMLLKKRFDGGFSIEDVFNCFDDDKIEDITDQLKETISNDAFEGCASAVAIMEEAEEDVDNITKNQLIEYFGGVDFVFDDFWCFQ